MRPRSRLALERAVQGGALPVLHRDLLRLALELSVEGLDLVLTGGKALDLEGAVLLAHGEERMVEHRDEGAHPGMDVASHRDHDLGLVELPGGLHALTGLAEIELRVALRAGMDVVESVVAVADLQGLTRPHGAHVGGVVATLLAVE